MENLKIPALLIHRYLLRHVIIFILLSFMHTFYYFMQLFINSYLFQIYRYFIYFIPKLLIKSIIKNSHIEQYLKKNFKNHLKICFRKRNVVCKLS